MKIHIQSADSQKINFPLKDSTRSGVSNAKSTWKSREALWIRLIDEDGEKGFGEACPLPGYSQETLEEVISEFENLKSHLIQNFKVDEYRILDSITQILKSFSVKARSLRYCLELAFLDLVAKKNQVSLNKLFSANADTSLNVCGLVYGQNAGERKYLFQKQWEEGIRAFKFKVYPTSFDEQITELKSLRDEYGSVWEIRLDANGSLKLEDWQLRKSQIDSLNIQWVEEPVSLVELSQIEGFPVALDESLHIEHWRKHLALCIDKKVLSAVILKPMALGGFSVCHEIMEMCKRENISVIISHLFESPIAFSGNVHFASAISKQAGVKQAVAGLYPHAGLYSCAEHGFQKMPFAYSGGTIELKDAHGLGVEMLPRLQIKGGREFLKEES